MRNSWAHPLTKEQQGGELLDRAGRQWEVFDIDGTREAARQRALPKGEDLPLPSGGWMRSVLLATPGASVGKLSGPARSFCKPTPLSGSVVSATEATGSTARN
ncbi:MAG TPA: hypothetical protein VHZ51_24920 [Ktedonobacteraceae bacterium]|nr:hypothetical protein [Ktedonobacteraceae bacterium]